MREGLNGRTEGGPSDRTVVAKRGASGEKSTMRVAHKVLTVLGDDWPGVLPN